MWSNITSSKRIHKLELTEAEACNRNPELYRANESDGTKINKESGLPLMRYKHAVCSAPSGYIYIHGGRFGNLALEDDVWRFDPHQNTWLQLHTQGQGKPPSLQEHTLLEFNEQLYLFGGQVSASNNENSFWRLDLVNNEWHSLSMKSSKFGAHLGPTNRRGHSAVIYADSMYIYGGFEDFRGSSAQLWEYQMLNQRWELRNLSSTSACHPEPRHSHSAIVYDHSMYVYGGLSNLKPLSDLWRWSWHEKRWFKERTRGNSPGQLHGHTAIQAFGSMFVFGGERNGRTTRSLWRLNLTNLTWQKIRPKGPRPNPTTWHGAIANPLSILDETNYIIEGDPEFLKNTSLSDNYFATYSNRGDDTDGQAVILAQQVTPPVKLEPKVVASSTLSHSKSSSADVTASRQGSSLLVNQNNDRLKRKSRLSFLRRCRQFDRPRSTYELKQIQSSESATNLASHSKCMGENVPSMADQQGQRETTSQVSLIEEGTNEMNVKILDNLDTDIKEMFQKALSPNQVRNSELEEEKDEPMSVDTTQIDQSITTASSQYQTAAQVSSMIDFNLRSQRTSYAYTTPPSELNTLKDTVQSQQKQQQNQLNHALFTASNTPMASGYNRRDNRPKSEIVQSLIDRADARIKHLYTPFFSHSNEHKQDGRNSDQKAKDGGHKQHHHQQYKNRRCLDKSKRHTIHQTMTYYNLYFSEDKSSNSPSSDSNPQAQEDQQKIERCESSSNKYPSVRMVRDDISSSTIKDSDQIVSITNGTLVGIHDGPQLDQESQLSLEDTCSDSKTLCGNTNSNSYNNNNMHHTASPDQFNSTFDNNSLQSSIPNALTARRDTTAESCDNTSLSFSVIAEFEEDDMLQYSSPTDPIHNFRQNASIEEYARSSCQINENRLALTTIVDECGSKPISTKPKNLNCQGMVQDDRGYDGDDNDEQLNRDKLTHKSTSSGYDSISGYEHFNRMRENNREPNSTIQTSSAGYQGREGGTSTSDTQEDSSVHTESSLGFTTTETSPEQSKLKNQYKKMKARPILSDRKIKSQAAFKITNSSTTADSLALTSDVFESSIGCQPPTISLPSSPCEKEESLQIQSMVQRMPLMSKPKFFSKQKSKNRYWQLCMFVIGGKQGGSIGMNEPITIWRLYI